MTSVRTFVLGGALACLTTLLALDPGKFELEADDPSRLILLGSLAAFGVALIWRHGATFLNRPESLLLFTSFGWIALVSPFGWYPGRGLLMALALSATVSIGLLIGRNQGWLWFLRLLGPALMVLLVAATAIELRSSGSGRWDGWAEEANALGVIAALAVIVGVAGVARREFWLAALVPLGAVVLITTEARIPTVAAACGSAIALRPRLGRSSPPFIIVAGVVAATALIAAGFGAERLVASDQLDGVGSLTGRVGAWQLVFDELDRDPLTGIGPEATQDMFSRRTDPLSWEPTHAHNAALQMALSGGWPASALFVASIIGYWLAARTRPVASRDALVAALTLMSITEHLVRDPSVALLILAVAFGSIVTERPDPHRAGWTSRAMDQLEQRRRLAEASH